MGEGTLSFPRMMRAGQMTLAAFQGERILLESLHALRANDLVHGSTARRLGVSASTRTTPTGQTRASGTRSLRTYDHVPDLTQFPAGSTHRLEMGPSTTGGNSALFALSSTSQRTKRRPPLPSASVEAAGGPLLPLQGTSDVLIPGEVQGPGRGGQHSGAQARVRRHSSMASSARTVMGFPAPVSLLPLDWPSRQCTTVHVKGLACYVLRCV